MKLEKGSRVMVVPGCGYGIGFGRELVDDGPQDLATYIERIDRSALVCRDSGMVEIVPLDQIRVLETGSDEKEGGTT